ncbi:MAG: helicase-related protein [candidate division WOR-3 bacterium]|nr:helicase-related protein [candidate division WOR-3 bacterium]
MVESQRLRLAYTYDPFFAVSLSGIRSLPHQLDAVYGRMLPQARLRFLLADDPGAGKTIMTGLLIKELKLRQAVERVLIIAPAALTIQWQDEMLKFFDEYFMPISGENDKQQLGDLWQRENQVVTSLDCARQPDVRERVWRAKWDLVVVDEAHKCSAYTRRRSERAPEVEKTKRYQLVEHFSAQPTLSLLFLTATPHQGNEDRFAHLLHLLDPDIFAEPHKFNEEKEREFRRGVFSLGRESPWMIRRMKEDMYGFDGRRLFPDRHSQTVTFCLSPDEYGLYQRVTSYLNRFLAGGSGRAKQSVALTRTVLQRRVASSAFAIYESLKRRLKRQQELLDELKALSPEKQRQRLAAIASARTMFDEERDEGDLDELERDELVDEAIAAQRLDELESEVAELHDLVDSARAVYERSPDTKLNTLKETLAKSEFAELRDGRGKLLIFTEHRDTMTYISEHLRRNGYTVCVIHGGMNPHDRKRAQDLFRTDVQVCVATEAAGEGINLQFCHLMINYDLPWNPARLEQRMGRIHRIGQERDVYVFNFVAERSTDGKPIIEGLVLKRLLDKLEEMRRALGSDRVFDAIGQILSLNDVNLPDILREAALHPGRLADYETQIANITPERLREYEDRAGIALARAFVDLPQSREQSLLAEEKRLMPEYVADYFQRASTLVGLGMEGRADGLFRIPNVPPDFRSESLEAVRSHGKPEHKYNKVTFYKDHLAQDRHLDAVLLSPGHPLYCAVDEKLNQKLASLQGRWASLVDAETPKPYFLHYFEVQLVGDYPTANRPLYAEVVAVQEQGNEMQVIPADVVHDLSPCPSLSAASAGPGRGSAEAYVRGTVQLDRRQQLLATRCKQADVIEEYLKKSFEERLWIAQQRAMELRGRREAGEREVDLALHEAQQDIENTERVRDDRLERVSRLRIVRPGPVRHIGSFAVYPPGFTPETAAVAEDLDAKQESELAAMKMVMEHERGQGRNPVDVSREKIGFDIRSTGSADASTGRYEVRRIEVKGRRRGAAVRLTENEMRNAKQLRDTYWLYVVWDPAGSNPDMHQIPDPVEKLGAWIKEVRIISEYEIPADAIAKAAT